MNLFHGNNVLLCFVVVVVVVVVVFFECTGCMKPVSFLSEVWKNSFH